MRKVETPNKPDAWRTEEVKLQLRKVRRALHRWQEKRSPQTHLNWVREEKALTAISRREKRKAKQAYAAQVATPRAMAQLTKAMANSPKHEIGLLKMDRASLQAPQRKPLTSYVTLTSTKVILPAIPLRKLKSKLHTED